MSVAIIVSARSASKGWHTWSEGFEQLSLLENNASVLRVEFHAKGREFRVVNNPGDILLVDQVTGAGQ